MGPARRARHRVRGEHGEPSRSATVEGLEMLVLVDNVTDQLSTNPEGVQSESTS